MFDMKNYYWMSTRDEMNMIDNVLKTHVCEGEEQTATRNKKRLYDTFLPLQKQFFDWGSVI